MINLFPDSSLSNSNLALLAWVTFRRRIWFAPSHNSKKLVYNISFSSLTKFLPRWNVWGKPPLQPGLHRTVRESFVSRDTRQSSGAPGNPEKYVFFCEKNKSLFRLLTVLSSSQVVIPIIAWDCSSDALCNKSFLKIRNRRVINWALRVIIEIGIGGSEKRRSKNI